MKSACSPVGTPVGYQQVAWRLWNWGREYWKWGFTATGPSPWSTRLALRSDRAIIGLHVAFKRCCHADVISRTDSLFSLLFVLFHTSTEWDTKDLMSVGTVQREFVHSSMTNTVWAITPSEPLLPTYQLFGKTGETDSFQVLPLPLFYFFYRPFQDPKGWKPSSCSCSVPGSRPGMEWWEIQFKRSKKCLQELLLHHR